jgi:cysteine desulfuration protein SufE
MNKLDEIVSQFQMLSPSDRLELLMEYADRLPALPEAYHALRDSGLYLIRECRSPVFLMVEVRQGYVHVVADVPQEAPVARGFVSVLVSAFDGVSVDEVMSAPPDLLQHLGLSGLLGMQRTRGLTAVYRRLVSETRRQARNG